MKSGRTATSPGELLERVAGIVRRWEREDPSGSLLASGWAQFSLWDTKSPGWVTAYWAGILSPGLLRFARLLALKGASLLFGVMPRLAVNRRLDPARDVLVISWTPDPRKDARRDRYLGSLNEPDGDRRMTRIGIVLGDRPGSWPGRFDGLVYFARTPMFNLSSLVRDLVLFAVSPGFRARHRLAALLSYEYRFARELCKLLERAFARRGYVPAVVLLPYEQQPWQVQICRMVSERFRVATVIGYVHASLNNLPLQFVKHRFTPDHLIVHGVAHRRALTELLGWPPERVHITGSFRFAKPMTLDRSSIFIPYSFTDGDAVLAGVRELVRSVPDLFRGLDVRLHPRKKDNPTHLALRSSIEGLTASAIAKDPGHPVGGDIVAVTVGVTNATLEALEAGYRVFAVFENPLHEALHQDIWPELTVISLGERAYELKLRRCGDFIRYLAGGEPDSIVDYIKWLLRLR